MLGLLRRLLLLISLLAVLWLAGLVGFAALTAALPRFNPEPTTLQADAIVVLTGGSERIRAGVDLLANKHAGKLFISGVHTGAKMPEVLAGVSVDRSLQQCCITLGYRALDTAGNAREVAAWLEKNQTITSIILVTAHYHMPRSLLEFRRQLPGLTIIAWAVAPARVQTDHWWQHDATLSLFLNEYHKLLAAFARFCLKKFGWT